MSGLRPWVKALLGYGVLGLVLVGGFVVMIESTAGPIRTSPSGVIAVGEVDGRSIAVVVYETDTFPHLDLFRIDSMGHSVQAEAFDLDSGERVWDTMLSNAYPSPDAEALAMGSEYVYVRSSEGLVILDAATGAVVSRDDGIAGLEQNYIASLDAYAWDAAGEEVVMLDVDGQVRSIPLDTLDASAASIPLATRWRDVLNTQERFPGEVYSPNQWDLVGYNAPLPDGETAVADWATPGWDVDVLLDAETGLAAGAPYGFAISQTYQPEIEHSESHVMQVGDLATGQRIGTAAVNDAAAAVVDDGRGHVVILSGNLPGQGLLVVASTNGIRTSVIGERGLLGW